MRNWFEALSPDFAATWRRFPLAVLLTLGGTIVAILAANRVFGYADQYMGTVCLGFVAGAVFAIGGAIFAESRPDKPKTAVALKYLAPLLVVGAHALDMPNIVYPWPLLGVAILWTSVSGFTRWGKDAEREEQQKRFWWINYHAIATGCVAAIALIVIVIGLFAIRTALDSLFGLSVDWLVQNWLLPVIALFLTPVYWLATIPRLDEYEPATLDSPDVLARAVGFLGQFVLVPLLLIYGAILLAYTAQIVVTQHLPDGTISWMVMGFVIVGAATWLVLYPPFMAARGLTKLFRRIWFWLTLVPLALFAVALWVRIDSYGFTPERVVLVAGGLWAALLAVIFLVRRGDMRLIPGLAAAIGLLTLVGPWGLENASIGSQASRLSAAMDRAGVTASRAGAVKWSVEDANIARGAVWYLYDHRGQHALREVLDEHQVLLMADGDAFAVGNVWAAIELSYETGSTYATLTRAAGSENALGGMTTYLGIVELNQTSANTSTAVSLILDGTALRVRDVLTGEQLDVPLASWAASERGDYFEDPILDFTFRGVPYRLIADYASIEENATNSDLSRHFTYLRGLLFRGGPETGNPPVTVSPPSINPPVAPTP